MCCSWSKSQFEVVWQVAFLDSDLQADISSYLPTTIVHWSYIPRAEPSPQVHQMNDSIYLSNFLDFSLDEFTDFTLALVKASHHRLTWCPAAPHCYHLSYDVVLGGCGGQHHHNNNINAMPPSSTPTRCACHHTCITTTRPTNIAHAMRRPSTQLWDDNNAVMTLTPLLPPPPPPHAYND